MASRPLRIKICGLTDTQVLRWMEGADMVGVVVDFPPSPRSVDRARARRILARADSKFETVAVLVDPTIEDLRCAWEELGAHLVQVHGEVPSGLTLSERSRVVPSLAVGAPPDAPGRKARDPSLYSHDPFPWIHLDAYAPQLRGGSGQRSDWNLARRWVEDYRAVSFLLGGGLTPENVRTALEAIGPDGVDVSSGVEDRPGRKSGPRIRRFIEEVRRWEEQNA
jgi:phosphoribosylanthranilate isomerase